jgi:hypothetical protein
MDVFWDVSPRSLVDMTNVSEMLPVSIIRPTMAPFIPMLETGSTCSLPDYSVITTSLQKSNRTFLIPYLKPPCKKFILYLKEVAFSNIHLERFIDDGKPYVILDVLPATVSVTYDACQEPIIMPERRNSKAHI